MYLYPPILTLLMFASSTSSPGGRLALISSMLNSSSGKWSPRTTNADMAVWPCRSPTALVIASPLSRTSLTASVSEIDLVATRAVYSPSEWPKANVQALATSNPNSCSSTLKIAMEVVRIAGWAFSVSFSFDYGQKTLAIYIHHIDIWGGNYLLPLEYQFHQIPTQGFVSFIENLLCWLGIAIIQVFSHTNILGTLAWEEYCRVRLFYASCTLQTTKHSVLERDFCISNVYISLVHTIHVRVWRGITALWAIFENFNIGGVAWGGGRRWPRRHQLIPRFDCSGRAHKSVSK